MILKNKNIPEFIDVHIFCTDRIGGYSSGNYTSFNLGLKSGDDFETVHKNRKLLAGVLWKNPDNFIYMNQEHGGNVCVIKKGEIYNGEGYDACITNDFKNIPIVLAADCTPIVIYDPVKEIIGAIHSGWRGTAQNILGNTVQKMKDEFGCSTDDIHVIIGPCISAKNYEVDTTVISHFSDMFYIKNQKGGYQLDLRGIIENQAKASGIINKKIYHIAMCTFERRDLFFSARRDGFGSGRFAMGIFKK